MKALLVVDMQVGLWRQDPVAVDVDGIVDRINELISSFRESGNCVVFIQHDGPQGSDFEPETDGWCLLPELRREGDDLVVRKTICDAFYESELDARLRERGVDEVVVVGWATDHCVDTTIRAAISHNYAVVAVADAHTVARRPHADADLLIAHHNATWKTLLTPSVAVRVVSTGEFVAGLEASG